MASVEEEIYTPEELAYSRQFELAVQRYDVLLADDKSPKLHGLVLEGTSPYGLGSTSQMAALAIAVYSGLPVVRVGRSDPGGRVPGFMHDLSIAGSNLDANKARLLLMASMLKLGRFPRAKDPRNPTSKEKDALLAKIAEFQEIFETH